MSDFSQNRVAGRDRDGFPSFESKAMANKKEKEKENRFQHLKHPPGNKLVYLKHPPGNKLVCTL
jgi:hypothetical protein